MPVRWQGGPLEVARRAAVKPVPPELAEALRGWYQPWSLDLLRDTPFNCVLVTWSGGTDAGLEREQQRIVREYAVEAHKRGMSVMALLPSIASLDRVASAAQNAGLDGLVVDDPSTGETLPRPATLSQAMPVIALFQSATAPGIRLFSKDGAVQATPTSEPWIDSDFWLVRSLRARGREPVWLGYTIEAPSTGDYLRAIADAEAAGGHWVIAPDDRLITGLASREPAAVLDWRRIVAALSFFNDHASWRQFLPAGPLGILQQDGAMGQENLNLVARRKIPYRLLDRAALSDPGLEGLQAVLAVGCALTPTERSALRQFAERGGLAIVSAAAGESIPKGQDFEVRQIGKGRLTVYRDEEPDPESLSKDVLHLLGRDNLGVRLFHAVTVLPVVSESRDGRQLLIAMVNYATEPAEAVIVRLAGDYRGARLYGLDTIPVSLELERSERGTQVKIPRVPVYAALVLEK